MTILLIIAAFVVMSLLAILAIETRKGMSNDKWPEDIDRFNEEEET